MTAEKRISAIYNGALKQILVDYKDFLQKIADVDSGKIKPPAFYDTPDKVAQWREGFVREQIRKEGIIAKAKARLDAAGIAVEPEIKQAMAEVYAGNRNYAVDYINKIRPSLSVPSLSDKQIAILIDDTMPPTTKIAYKNLGKNPQVVARLQNELGIATSLGESQRDIVKRIRKVTGQSMYQATRVAQTERTRLQSQARNDVIEEANAQGIRVAREWSARMVHGRDTHAALDGQVREDGVPFDLIDGDKLMYPGDPNGRPENTINCHCVLIPRVL